MSSSSSFSVMVVEGLHFIRQKKARRAPGCSLNQDGIAQRKWHLIGGRVSDPHPFQADPDPGFEIFLDADLDPDPGCEKFADPDPGLYFYEK